MFVSAAERESARRREQAIEGKRRFMEREVSRVAAAGISSELAMRKS
jgi:hypothetical protein